MKGDRVTRIRGDRDDVFSHGYICPKGSTLRQLHEDPDRLRTPLVRRDGELVEVTWDEAFAEVEQRLHRRRRRARARARSASTSGNPNAHNLSALLYLKPLLKALGHPQRVLGQHRRPAARRSCRRRGCSAAGLSIPVPDVDRTDLLVILGANPYASNGSLATAPDWPGRIEAMRERGGRLVVVDPRRSRTAEEADWHLAIRPGTDALLLAALVTTLAEEGRIDPGAGRASGCRASTRCSPRWRRSRPRPWRRRSGITADDIRRLARELGRRAQRRGLRPHGHHHRRVRHPRLLAGRRASTCAPATSTGPAGPCSPRRRPARPTPGASRASGRGLKVGRHGSRVRGLAETMGELPASCLAEEIDTPGEGQIRALVTVAGNPVLSTPNGGRLDAALDQPRLLRGRRHLRERDHPPRRRDPPAAQRAPEAPLRPGAAPGGPPQRRQLLAAGAAARRRPARRVGDPGPPRPHRPGDGRRRRRRHRRRPGDHHAWSTGPWATRTVRCTAATPSEILAALAPRTRPGAPARPAAAHRPLRRRVRRPHRGGGARRAAAERSTCCSTNPHGVDLGAARAPAARGPAHAHRHGRARPCPRCWPTCPGWPRGARPGRCPRRCSWAGGTSARTTRGCTTSRCW